MIVSISWEGLTVRAEINVIANSTLVANALNVALGRLILAQGAVTENTIVNVHLMGQLVGDSFIDRSESVARVRLLGKRDTSSAIVPVWAAQTLVAGANNAFVTAITNGSMLELTTWKTASYDHVLKSVIAVNSGSESVCGMVTMLVTQQAAEAQIIVFTVHATDKVDVVVFYRMHQCGSQAIFEAREVPTTAASIANWPLLTRGSEIRASGIWRSDNRGGGSNNRNGRTRHLRDELARERCDGCDRLHSLGRLLARRDFLGGAVSDETAVNHPLDQPVTFSAARCTSINTLGAQIIVSVLANTAVVVLICNGTTAVVAVNAEHTTGRVVRDNRETKFFLLHIEVSVTGWIRG
jgi:hypothetical protein